MLLQINNLNVTLGGLHIIQDVSMNVKEGELVVVVGANGAGKSTLLRTVAGMNGCQTGSVVFDGVELANRTAPEVAKAGLCMIPEGRQLFPELSAKDNLLIGAYTRRKNKKQVLENLEKIYEMFPVIKKNQNRIASTFSGGEQQMISIGRGLMSEPKMLMIDELSLGLAPLIIESLLQFIKQLNTTGMSILLIEQNAKQALRIADRGYVMESGRVALEGTGMELLNNSHVQVAYLGL